MHIRTEPIVIHEDARGALMKAWPSPVAGEVYAVELRPGHPRGHHYHHHGGEWFVPLQGAAILVAEDPQTRARIVLRLDGLRARVEPGIAHALFAADGKPALILAIADRDWATEETTPFQVSPP